MPRSSSLAAILVVLLAAGAAADPASCAVAKVDDIDGSDGSAAVHLLQVGVARVAREAMRGGALNLSRTYGEPGSCDKVTTGTCLLGKQCDASRNAQCTNGWMCTCPELMCHDGRGTCRLEPSEVAAAVTSNVEDVVEKVSTAAGIAKNTAEWIVRAVTGTANVVNKASGIFDDATESANSAWETWMGGSSTGDTCSRTVGFCLLSGCPQSVEGRATCSWGKCSCEPDYCYESRRGKDMCIYNFKKVFREGLDIFGIRGSSREEAGSLQAASRQRSEESVPSVVAQ